MQKFTVLLKAFAYFYLSIWTMKQKLCSHFALSKMLIKCINGRKYVPTSFCILKRICDFTNSTVLVLYSNSVFEITSVTY